MVLLCALVISTLGVLGYVIFSENEKLKDVLLGLNVASIILLIIYCPLSSSVRCPLCQGRPIVRSGSSRNWKAKPLLGSHRLRVAGAVIFKNCFRCPHCGEVTAMQARETHGSRRKF